MSMLASRKNTARKKYNIFLWICILLVAVSGGNSAIAKEQESDEVAARVNGVEISRQAVERAEAFIQGTTRDESTKINQQEQQRKFRLSLENLITEELLYQESVARKIKIEKEKVYEVINQMKASMPGAKFTKLAFAHWAVKGEILKTIERDLMIQQLFKEAVVDQATVSEDDVLCFYKTQESLFQTGPEVRLQQIILFAEPEWHAELLRDKAKEIATRSRSGEDFVELARAYSQGPSRDQGGDLGWRSINHLPESLRSAVEAAEVGVTIDPIQMPGGLIIAKVLAKRPSRITPFLEVRSRLESILKDNKLRDRRNAFLQELRSRAKIEVLLP